MAHAAGNISTVLDGMLNQQGLAPTVLILQYWFIYLGGERNYGSKVSYPRTKHMDTGLHDMIV